MKILKNISVSSAKAPLNVEQIHNLLQEKLTTWCSESISEKCTSREKVQYVISEK